MADLVGVGVGTLDDTLVDQRIRFHRIGCATSRKGLPALVTLLGARDALFGARVTFSERVCTTRQRYVHAGWRFWFDGSDQTYFNGAPLLGVS
ncbi:hypothetical protein U1Q18_016403 [Sarracenia purpurea var. burkii]